MTTTAKATPAKNTKPIMSLGADLSPALKAIEAAYRMYQRAFPDAPNVTIVIKRDERAWGHTTVAKVWAPSKATKGGAAPAAASQFEIMVSGENLRRGAEAVASTLLHEAAHARNLNKGILDTDTNGRHNKTFKTTAEEHGLTITEVGWHGWTGTEMSEEGRQRWAKLIATIDAGLAKSAATAAANLDHLPKRGKGAKAGTGEPDGSEGGKAAGPVAPPKRGNKNLLKAECQCGHSIRVSQKVLDVARPTCQVCNEPFVAVGR